MAPEWSLRPATADDRAFLLDLNRAAFRPSVELVWGWDEAEQVAFFDQRFDPARRQILQVGGVDAGELMVEERETVLHLTRIALLPEFQGRGLGTSIVRSLLDRAAASGRAVVLEVLHENPRAEALYERLGFERTGQTVTHVLMRAEPAPRP